MGIKDRIFGGSTDDETSDDDDTTVPRRETAAETQAAADTSWVSSGPDAPYQSPPPTSQFDEWFEDCSESVLVGGYDVTNADVDESKVYVNDEWWAEEGSAQLTDAIKSCGYSTTEIADVFNMSYSTINSHMRGTTTPGSELLGGYIEFFGESYFEDAEYDVRVCGCPHHD